MWDEVLDGFKGKDEAHLVVGVPHLPPLSVVQEPSGGGLSVREGGMDKERDRGRRREGGSVCERERDGERTSEQPPIEEGTAGKVLRTSTMQPRPESGPDCLLCATFARQRWGAYSLWEPTNSARLR